MTTHDTTQVLRELEATCGCTYAARTAAEAMRELVTEHAAMLKTLQRAAHVLAELDDGTATQEVMQLRHRIVGDIKMVAPEYYGERRKLAQNGL